MKNIHTVLCDISQYGKGKQILVMYLKKWCLIPLFALWVLVICWVHWKVQLGAELIMRKLLLNRLLVLQTHDCVVHHDDMAFYRTNEHYVCKLKYISVIYIALIFLPKTHKFSRKTSPLGTGRRTCTGIQKRHFPQSSIHHSLCQASVIWAGLVLVIRISVQ